MHFLVLKQIFFQIHKYRKIGALFKIIQNYTITFIAIKKCKITLRDTIETSMGAMKLAAQLRPAGDVPP